MIDAIAPAEKARRQREEMLHVDDLSALDASDPYEGQRVPFDEDPWCDEATGASSYAHVERLAQLQAENEQLRAQVKAQAERLALADDDADRLAAALRLLRTRSNVADYLNGREHLGLDNTMRRHERHQEPNR